MILYVLNIYEILIIVYKWNFSEQLLHADNRRERFQTQDI